MRDILDRVARCGELPELGLGPLAQAQVAGLFAPGFLSLHAACEVYTARVAMGLCLDLGWEAALRQGASVDELVAGLAPQARIPTEWMLPFLADEGFLKREGDRYRLEGSPDLDLAGIRAFAETTTREHGVNFDLLDAVRRQIRPFFTEGRPGEQLLFDLALLPLWTTYFRNENLGYFPNNLFTLIALREALPEGARILEVGAGSGSFAELLARDGAEQGYLPKIRDYLFTDITPTFLRRAQRELPGRAPGLPLRFAPLDINRGFEEQHLAGGPFDAIVGVNVLHVAKELLPTLVRLREQLAPGGRLVLGECLKPDLGRPIYLEFFFKFMKGFTDVNLDPEYRPTHGFLTPEAWERALLAAGFHTVRRAPDTRALMATYPTFYVGALAAEV